MHNIVDFTHIVLVVIFNFYFHHNKLRLYKNIQVSQTNIFINL